MVGWDERGDGMSQLRSILDQLALVDPEALTIDELDVEITEIVRGREFFDVLLAKHVKAMSDQNGHAQLGFPSPTAYLKHRGRMSGGHAQQVVARSNAAKKAPVAFRAWEDGRLSTDQTRHLFAAAESVPDAYPQAEEKLLDIVDGLCVSDTARTVEYWRQAVDGPGELDTQTELFRRGVSLSKTTGGMRRVDGWMTRAAGDALEAALGALMAPPTQDDHRSPRQRRHDALEDLCRDWLDHRDTPTVGGEKPHIIVLADLQALQGIAGGTHENLRGDIINVDMLRQLACDASISRIILGPESEILDVGRKTRAWTVAQRRAIIARDRHCQGQGCDRDARWCDIHHLDHWADGGKTDIDKGVLLCRWHHTCERQTGDIRSRRRDRTEG